MSIIISLFALAVSILTAWLTLLHRGRVQMTRPTIIYFGYDGSPTRDGVTKPKIYLRTLLFATSKRGQIIESLHVSLHRNETHQNFSFWVYGEKELKRGSGLFVDERGVALNHHFLTPKDGGTFQFLEGQYRFKVYAKILGGRKPVLLYSLELNIPKEIALKLKEPQAGLYFDWGPESSQYISHVEERPPLPSPDKLLEAMGIFK